MSQNAIDGSFRSDLQQFADASIRFGRLVILSLFFFALRLFSLFLMVFEEIWLIDLMYGVFCVVVPLILGLLWRRYRLRWCAELHRLATLIPHPTAMESKRLYLRGHRFELLGVVGYACSLAGMFFFIRIRDWWEPVGPLVLVVTGGVMLYGFCFAYLLYILGSQKLDLWFEFLADFIPEGETWTVEENTAAIHRGHRLDFCFGLGKLDLGFGFLRLGKTLREIADQLQGDGSELLAAILAQIPPSKPPK